VSQKDYKMHTGRVKIGLTDFKTNRNCFKVSGC